MSTEGLEPAVERFIDDHIASVAQLELLLLLQQARDQVWKPEELARELRVETAWAEAQLRAFAAARIVSPASDQAAYRYLPESDELERAVAGLSRAYLLQRVRVIERIYGRTSSRIRAFADAFRLKKEKPDG
jgi:hypothetical protein